MRTLQFRNFDDALSEVERLARMGHSQSGNWGLAQICDHLAYFIEGSLDGHPYKVPWLLKVLFGRIALKRILTQKRMKARTPTPQRPLPDPRQDESEAIERLRTAIARLKAHKGEMYDSPFFGHLTPEEWRELHLIHCQHHLAFLEPKTDH